MWAKIVNNVQVPVPMHACAYPEHCDNINAHMTLVSAYLHQYCELV